MTGYWYDAKGSQAVPNFGEPLGLSIGPILNEMSAIWLPAADAPAQANVRGSELSLMFARRHQTTPIRAEHATCRRPRPLISTALCEMLKSRPEA
jgi:hypothetical protein